MELLVVIAIIDIMVGLPTSRANGTRSCTSGRRKCSDVWLNCRAAPTTPI
ncbi:MAG: hypothetical protein U0892_01715 [Pirellulales bacterium]